MSTNANIQTSTTVRSSNNVHRCVFRRCLDSERRYGSKVFDSINRFLVFETKGRIQKGHKNDDRFRFCEIIFICKFILLKKYFCFLADVYHYVYKTMLRVFLLFCCLCQICRVIQLLYVDFSVRW